MDRRDLFPIMACGALLLMLALQLALPIGGPAAESGGLAPRRPRLVDAPPIPDYPAILQAPLFAPDRAPGPAGLTEGAVAGPLAAYAALGVAAGGGAATAVVSGPGGITKTLRRGETLEGWTLASVEPGRITFERDGARHVLVVGAPPEALSEAAKSPAAPTETSEP